MIKAPYNFVPLAKTAFYPEWANRISQDIPFEDGVSGSIEYTMEAKTPIFVRNGYTDRKNPDVTFSQTKDGRYFIPGTSVKGEIRNVLEILSFGKMTQVQDARFGIRDLNGSDKREYTRRVANAYCGWLYKNTNGQYCIDDCGVPGRIETRSILASIISINDYRRKNADNEVYASNEVEDILKSATIKYFSCGFTKDNLLDQDFFCRAQINKRFISTDIPRRNQYDRRQFFAINNGGKAGTIVFTGQPSRQKKYDYVFFPVKKVRNVAIDIVNDFLSINRNNYDYTNVWEERLSKGFKIPVFFTLRDGLVDAIGLSYMFRLPSANFIKGAIPAALQSACRKDLAECIFGAAKSELRCLKGRVFFSPAFAINCAKEREVRAVLSSPKPSFGPLYVKHGTWNYSQAEIKGRKRYPVRDEVWENDSSNENVLTKFRALESGIKFRGKISFHNLRQCELGALISALTFDGHSECFHSIGEAKPLGYGKVKIVIGNITDTPILGDSTISDADCSEKVRYYLGVFHDMMDRVWPNWNNTASVKELLAMAKGLTKDKLEWFKYLEMITGDRDADEFTQVKNCKENLPYFTDIIKGKYSSVSGGDWRRKYDRELREEINELDQASKDDMLEQ